MGNLALATAGTNLDTICGSRMCFNFLDRGESRDEK